MERLSCHDTKVIIRKIREYDGRWLDVDGETFFLPGKPDKEKIVDAICRLCSQDGRVIIDAKFEVGEVTLRDFMMSNP